MILHLLPSTTSHPPPPQPQQLPLKNNPSTNRPPKPLPPSSKPRNHTNAHNNPHSRRRIIHILAVDGVVAGEIERDGAEDEVEEADGVQGDGPFAEAVVAADVGCGGRREEGEEAGEEGEGVGYICWGVSV